MVHADIKILSRLREGDKNTFRDLFDDHYRNMVLYAKKFVVETEIARDLVQDVFIYVWDRRSELCINRSINSYLFRAVHNACINYLKRESNKEEYVKNFLLKIHGDHSLSLKNGDAHEIVVHNDLLERIELIIDGLPEQCRNIFRMSRFRGMRNKEIADLYAISHRTVETQIYRALKILKERLQPYMSVTTALFLILSRIFLVL